MNNLKYWLYATLYLLLIVFIWLSLILVKLPITLPVTIISKFKDTSVVLGKTIDWRKWAYNIWVGDDQCINATLGGDRDISISSRIGYNAEGGNPIALRMEKVINKIFKIAIGQDNHCRVSIERDENHNKNWGG